MFKPGDFNIKETWLPPKPRRDSKEDVRQSGKELQKKVPSAGPRSEPRRDDVIPTAENLDSEVAKIVLRDLYAAGIPKSNPVITKSNSRESYGGDLQPQPKWNKQHEYKDVTPPKPGDSDLISKLSARLTKLEMTVKSQREEIKEKSTVIAKQKDEIMMLKGLSSEDDQADMEKLMEENQKMRKQIQEMEQFLNDYGLVWIGADAHKGAFDKKAIDRDLAAKPKYNLNLPKEIDVVLLTRRIEELNLCLEKEGLSKFVKDKDGAHRLKRLDPIPIAFYKNGVIIKGTPFFPYNSPQGQQILADILEGYFPYQLKKEYPDGVQLKLLDKIDEVYKGEIDPQKIYNVNNIDEKALQPLTKEEFLAKLPKNIIKNGKIIPIQDEVAKKLGVEKETSEGTKNILVKNDVLTRIDENQLSEEEKAELVTLKVRTETGKYNLIIKVMASDSLDVVYALVDPYSETKKYLIATTFPNQTYERKDPQNMRELGFYPNSALFLKAT